MNTYPSSLEDFNLLFSWVLANRLLMPRLQIIVLLKIGELNKADKRATGFRGLEYAYDNTTKGSSLRAFLVAEHTRLIRSCVSQKLPSTKDFTKYYPRIMLEEMVLALADVAGKAADGWKDIDTSLYLVAED